MTAKASAAPSCSDPDRTRWPAGGGSVDIRRMSAGSTSREPSASSSKALEDRIEVRRIEVADVRIVEHHGPAADQGRFDAGDRGERCEPLRPRRDRGADELELRPAGGWWKRSGFEFGVRREHDSRGHRGGTRTQWWDRSPRPARPAAASVLDRDGKTECAIADHREAGRWERIVLG